MASSNQAPAIGGHSVACCNLPPVVGKGYTKKGDYETIDGRKTYVTGPAKEATKGILSVMDIFGYFDQTIQGADLLATSDTHNKYAVFLPDAFDGEPFPISNFPPDTEEKQKALGAFFGKNSPPSFAEKVPGLIKAYSAKYPNIKSWAIVGYCWGGKVASLVTSGGNTTFSAAAELHPAMLDAKDAVSIKVPIIILASKDEDANDVKKFQEALTVPKHVEIFETSLHGWAAARADLEDEAQKKEYVRAYETVLSFFHKEWKN